MPAKKNNKKSKKGSKSKNAPKATPKVVAEAAPEVVVEAVPEVVVEAAPEVATDAAPEVAPEVATEAAPEVATEAPAKGGKRASKGTKASASKSSKAASKGSKASASKSSKAASKGSKASASKGSKVASKGSKASASKGSRSKAGSKGSKVASKGSRSKAVSKKPVKRSRFLNVDENGKPIIRTFRRRDNGTYVGYFKAFKPKQASGKAFTRICRSREENGETTDGEIRFCIKECTRGSLQKTYYYIGVRTKLDTPTTVTIGKGDEAREISHRYKSKIRRDWNPPEQSTEQPATEVEVAA